jgi:hypothetical protein
LAPRRIDPRLSELMRWMTRPHPMPVPTVVVRSSKPMSISSIRSRSHTNRSTVSLTFISAAIGSAANAFRASASCKLPRRWEPLRHSRGRALKPQSSS